MATTTDGVTEPDAVALPGFDGAPPRPPPPRYTKPAHAARKPPIGPVRKTIREIGFALITAGVVVLLFVAYQLWGTGFAERASQSKLATQFKAVTAAPTADSAAPDSPTLGVGAPAVPGPPAGAAVDHLQISKIGVDAYVVEGVGEDSLKQGPGHYPGTPLPGEPGNASIAGHRTTYGAPFFNLDQLVSGDEILVTNKAGKTFHYIVFQSEVVKPTDVAVIAATTDNRLTLTTCNPRYSATSRLIVVAKLTDVPVTPPPTVAPPVIQASTVTLGTGDHSAWPATLEWGLLFVALWAGVRLLGARRRSWRWIPFAVGIPLCLAPLWFLFENVIRLLPNNI